METAFPGSVGYHLSLRTAEIRLIAQSLAGLRGEKVLGGSSDENIIRLSKTTQLPVVSAPGSVSKLGLDAAQFEASLHSDGVESHRLFLHVTVNCSDFRVNDDAKHE